VVVVSEAHLERSGRRVHGVGGKAAQDELVRELGGTQCVADTSSVVDRQAKRFRRRDEGVRSLDQCPRLAGLENISAEAVDDNVGA
jgi:hypothetical protein